MDYFGLTIAILLGVTGLNAQKNNVCSTFVDYFFMENNPNCWYDPDLDLDLFGILGRHGINVETYNVETKDGYILTLFRLPRTDPKGVVFLVHPMTQTSSIWFNAQNNSLGFVLYDAGYEVWLPHVRGSYYSSSHHNLTTHQYSYWNFTFHEMGIYDIPVGLDMVKNITKRSDIIYIGYSLSTTSAAVYASMLPEHAKNSVKVFIWIGPTIYISFAHMKSFKILSDLKKVATIYDKLEMGSVVHSFGFMKALVKLLCDSHPLKFLCWIVLEREFEGMKNFDPARTSYVLRNTKSRVPVKVLRHFYQVENSTRFQQYSYGKEGNLIRYNSTKPPLYPIENINVPVYIIYGGKDKAASKTRVERFYNELPQEAKIYGKHFIPDYNHLDFILAKDCRELVYDEILRLLKKIK